MDSHWLEGELPDLKDLPLPLEDLDDIDLSTLLDNAEAHQSAVYQQGTGQPQPDPDVQAVYTDFSNDCSQQFYPQPVHHHQSVEAVPATAVEYFPQPVEGGQPQQQNYQPGYGDQMYQQEECLQAAHHQNALMQDAEEATTSTADQTLPLPGTVDKGKVQKKRGSRKGRIPLKSRALKVIYDLALNAPDGIVQRQQILEADPELAADLETNKFQALNTLCKKDKVLVYLKDLYGKEYKGKYGLSEAGRAKCFEEYGY